MIICHNRSSSPVRVLGLAAAFLLVASAVAWGGKVSLVEDGATQYTITIDGKLMTNADGSPRLLPRLADAKSIAEIHILAKSGTQVVITGIQRWEAIYTSGNKGKANKNNDPPVNEPAEPDAPQEPEAPVEPDAPQEPDAPVEPDQPQEPDAPAEPQEPDAPAEPDAPEEPIEPEVPQDPEPELPDVQEPQIDFPDRMVPAPTVELDALVTGATQIWVSANGNGDGRTADHPTTLDAAVASIAAADGGHYVVRLANGERHTMSKPWPNKAAGESGTSPIVVMPAKPQGSQPIVVGTAGSPAMTFETPRHIVVHGIQFGSPLAESVRVVANADDAFERSIVFDGCTFFGSKHGLTASSAGGTSTRVEVVVRNSLFADNREAAVVMTRAKDLKILDSAIAFASPPQKATPALDFIAADAVEVSRNVITRASGPAIRVNGGIRVSVFDNAFVANVASGELFGRPQSVLWAGNVTINSLATGSTAGLCVRSVKNGRFHKNLFVNSHGVGGPAILVGRDVSDGDENVSGAIFSENIIYDAHATAVQIDWVVAEDVEFDSNLTQSSGAIGQPSIASKWVSADVAPGISASGERFALTAAGNAVSVGNTSGGYELWTQMTGGGVVTAPVNFVDPKREAALYNRVGMDGEEDAEALVEAIRSGHVAADPLVEWVRAGFEIVTIEDEPHDPPAEPEDPPVEPEDPPVEPEDPPVEPEDPPVEPEDPPVQPDDPPVPGDVIAIHVDSPGGPSVGNDANDGRTPETAVATIARAQTLAYWIRKADPAAPLEFRFRRGDNFGAWGICWAKRSHEPNDYYANSVAGTAERYTLFTGYGSGAKPNFVSDETVFRMVNDEKGNLGSFLEFRGLASQGKGAFISFLSAGRGMRIVDCDLNGKNVMVQAIYNAPYSDMEIIDTLIWNCLTTSGHRSGLFLKNVDGLTLDRVVLYRNGWNGTPDMPNSELGKDVYNHGAYITAECDDVKITNTSAIFNAGGGLQMRPGGDLRDSFVAWNARTGVDWGLVNGSPTGVGGKTGEVTGNLIIDSGDAWGFGVSNIRSGHVHHNTFVHVRGLRQPVLLRADHGPNTHSKDVEGAERVGLNDLVIEDNTIIGDVTLQYDGWGQRGGDGVLLRRNVVTGSFTQRNPFEDPNGKIVIEDGQSGFPAAGIAEPEMSPELIERILSRELRATDLIQMFTPQTTQVATPE